MQPRGSHHTNSLIGERRHPLFLDFQIDPTSEVGNWRLEKLLEAVLNTPQGEVIDPHRLDLALKNTEFVYGTVVTGSKTFFIPELRGRGLRTKQAIGMGTRITGEGVILLAGYLCSYYALHPTRRPLPTIVAILRGLADTPYSAQHGSLSARP